MQIFERYESSDDEVCKAITIIYQELQNPENSPAREAFEWWIQAYKIARVATTKDQIKTAVRLYLCTDHIHSASPYNIAQGLMKATIHRLWRNLYLLKTRDGHNTVQPAILDVIVPEKDRAIQYMRGVMEEIAAETNESVPEMMTRICGDK